MEPNVADIFAEGNAFAEQGNEKFRELGGDVNNPEWFDYCAQMDAWTAANDDGQA